MESTPAGQSKECDKSLLSAFGIPLQPNSKDLFSKKVFLTGNGIAVTKESSSVTSYPTELNSRAKHPGVCTPSLPHDHGAGQDQMISNGDLFSAAESNDSTASLSPIIISPITTRSTVMISNDELMENNPSTTEHFFLQGLKVRDKDYSTGYAYKMQSKGFCNALQDGLSKHKPKGCTASQIKQLRVPLKLRLKKLGLYLPPARPLTLPDQYLQYNMCVPVEREFRLRLISPWDMPIDQTEEAWLACRFDHDTGTLWGLFSMGSKHGLMFVENVDPLYDWSVEVSPTVRCEWCCCDVKTGESRSGDGCEGSIEFSARRGARGVLFGLFDGWDVQFFSEAIFKDMRNAWLDWQEWPAVWDRFMAGPQER